jgi:hypothetical protein
MIAASSLVLATYTALAYFAPAHEFVATRATLESMDTWYFAVTTAAVTRYCRYLMVTA